MTWVYTKQQQQLQPTLYIFPGTRGNKYYYSVLSLSKNFSYCFYFYTFGVMFVETYYLYLRFNESVIMVFQSESS